MQGLILTDCILGLKQLDPESVDVIFTSPPYNLDIKYSTYQDNKPRESYLDWLDGVFLELKRVLKPDGHFWLNMGYSNQDPWIGMDVAQRARKYFVLQNNFIWAKSISIDGEQIGHYKPINSQRYANPVWEHLYHFTIFGDIKCDKLAVGVPYVDKSNLDQSHRIKSRIIKKMGFKNRKDFDLNSTLDQKQKMQQVFDTKIQRRGEIKDSHCPGNIWLVTYDTIFDRMIERGDHPAIFPIELVDRAIRFSNIKQGLILDPFVGTGTTALAAKNLGLSYLGFDIDEKYLEFAMKRLEGSE
jgi:site-specific DNA-methyltransferase (adenine-specific)